MCYENAAAAGANDDVTIGIDTDAVTLTTVISCDSSRCCQKHTVCCALAVGSCVWSSVKSQILCYKGDVACSPSVTVNVNMTVSLSPVCYQCNMLQ